MFYVLDENNNKVEAYDKQAVLAILAQAIEEGTLENITADSAFINKLKCCVGGDTFNMAFVTQAKYNELVANKLVKENTYYYIIDDETAENIDEALEALNDAVTALTKGLKTANDALTTQGTSITNLDAAASKKSEAKQYLSNSNFKSTDLIYDTSLSGANQPRVDISNLMLEGKEAADTIGMSGRLYINGSEHSVFFSTLWNAYDNNYSYCVAYEHTSAGDIILYTFEIGIDANKKIYMSNIKGINLTTNTAVTISTVRPYFINIFYK